MSKAFQRNLKILTTIVTMGLVIVSAGCKSSSGLIGPFDETAEAAEIVADANKDLKEIKVLYRNNEKKREDIIAAMKSDDEPTVKKLSEEVVQAINEGTLSGKNALDKIEKARELNVNEDYAEYLRLKWEALNKQLEAFEEYRLAARTLRNSYEPKNAQAHDIVEADFTSRSENFQKLMEKARDYSSEANELAKDIQRRQKGQ